MWGLISGIVVTRLQSQTIEKIRKYDICQCLTKLYPCVHGLPVLSFESCGRRKLRCQEKLCYSL